MIAVRQDGSSDDVLSCEEFARALRQHVASRPVAEAFTRTGENYLDDLFTLRTIDSGSVTLKGAHGGDEITLALPESVTSNARVGWSVKMQLACIEGQWRILGIGHVHS